MLNDRTERSTRREGKFCSAAPLPSRAHLQAQAKPLKAPKKEKVEEDEDDKVRSTLSRSRPAFSDDLAQAFKEKQKAAAAAQKAAADKLAGGGKLGAGLKKCARPFNCTGVRDQNAVYRSGKK